MECNIGAFKRFRSPPSFSYPPVRHVPSTRLSHRNGQNHFVPEQKNLRFFVLLFFAPQHPASHTKGERIFLAIQTDFWLFHINDAAYFSNIVLRPSLNYESSVFKKSQKLHHHHCFSFRWRKIDGGTLMYVIKWNIYKNYKLINSLLEKKHKRNRYIEILEEVHKFLLYFKIFLFRRRIEVFRKEFSQSRLNKSLSHYSIIIRLENMDSV